MKRLMKRLLRLILRVAHINLWTFLAAGLVLFVAGITTGRMCHSIKIDFLSSFLFIAGIVLLSVAISKTGGEVRKPAAKVEKPEVKKERGAKRKEDAVTETVSWNI